MSSPSSVSASSVATSMASLSLGGSSRKPAATNLKPGEVVMDRHSGKDERYWCLPPFHGDRGNPPRPPKSGYQYHLVFQGHKVGTFDNWGEAKISLSGYPGASNKGYDTERECIEGWQTMCPLGIHPHPVEPSVASQASLPKLLSSPTPPSSPSVNTDPRTPSKRAKSEKTRAPPPARSQGDHPAHLSTPSTPKKAGSSKSLSLNFAIRGEGIVSSSASRAQERYLELQRLGAQPDMIVTRDILEASLFALEDEGESDEAEAAV
ncbi:hypothetical protein C8R47DRAFT_1230725 [Mycena vitilis]|nr:hypothetical protein C8R47DRAFT_1230725 [Mycena vitilis]